MSRSCWRLVALVVPRAVPARAFLSPIVIDGESLIKLDSTEDAVPASDVCRCHRADEWIPLLNEPKIARGTISISRSLVSAIPQAGDC
jgi:hypothetical protein